RVASPRAAARGSRPRRPTDRASEPARRLAPPGSRITVRIEMISPDRPARPPVASLHDWWRTAQLGLRSTEVTAVGLRPAGPTPAVQDAIGSIRDPGTLPQRLSEREPSSPSC